MTTIRSDLSCRKTPLDATHRRLGARFSPFAGWEMPLCYGDEREEHLAVRTRAGLFDLFHTGEITVSGSQAAKALDHALVGHISALAVGRAQYTMICADDGGVIDDLIIYRTGEQEFLVAANASNAETVLSELTTRAASYPGSEVRDDRDTYALIAIQGPAAAAILAPVSSANMDRLKYYSVVHGTVAGTDAIIARTGYTGEDGFELYVSADAAESLWEALTAAGASRGLVPAGTSCRNTLRLEAGMPRYGHELTTATTPYDAGRGWVVRFDKVTNNGRFIGRDALVKAAEAARMSRSRSLIGLMAEGCRVPLADHAVVNESGAKIGEVTSGAFSPTLGKPIAMAYVDTRHVRRLNHVTVDIYGTYEPCQVVALPFYKRTRSLSPLIGTPADASHA